jgi:acyl-CoA hydrolase
MWEQTSMWWMTVSRSASTSNGPDGANLLETERWSSTRRRGRVGTASDTMCVMARHPAETVSVLTYRTGIQDANLAGNVHGGWIMKLCDDVAAIAATRLAGGRVVTAAVDAMKFRSPVKVGDLITLRASVNAAWRTSMEVGVRVEAEHVPTGEIAHTCSAYLTMVSLGQDEKPVPVPALDPETPEDERRQRDANRRRELRLGAPGGLRSVRAS